MLAFVNANLIDGTGASPRARQRALLDGKRIVAIGRRVLIPEGAAVCDLGGRTLMPGLIDIHAHLGNGYRRGLASGVETGDYRDARNLCLANGVTTIRSCGDYQNDSISVRDRINAGRLRGPRLIISGKHFLSRESHPAATVWGDNNGTLENCGLIPNTPNECREMVRGQVDSGVDYIKIIMSFGHYSMWPKRLSPISYDKVAAIIDESHKLGKTVACHVETLEQATKAAEYGANELHHLVECGSEITEATKYEALFRRMCEDNIALIPTLAIHRRNERFRVEKGITDSGIAHAVELFRCAYDFGVLLGCGTDSGAPLVPWGASLHGEMEEFVESIGMTPLEAIRCATDNNARIAGMEGKIGRISAGANADILILDKDPSTNIYDTGGIYMVLREGQVVYGEGSSLAGEDLIEPCPPRPYCRW